MPKTKTKAKASSKPKAKPKPQPRTAAASKPKPRQRTAAAAKPKPPAGLDPRLLAAITLALHDESIAQARADRLQSEASQWTILARARGMRSR